MVAFVACTSRGTLTVERDPVLVATPIGCKQTMCDYFYASCVDPCTECWNVCGRQDDEASVVRCADTCKQICASDHSASPSNCEVERNACRWTHRNGICVDNLEDDTPEGHLSCTFQMSAANCACGTDEGCLGALDRLNTKCRKCNAGWVMPCLQAACSAETEQSLACMREKGCSLVNSCEHCQVAAAALTTCFENAQQDPRDIGGCYSKPRACSGEPLCPYVLY